MHPLPKHRSLSFWVLGTVDDAPNWKPHLKDIISKISRNLNLLRLLRHLLDFNSALLFYYNFIHPHIISGLVLYYFSCPTSATNPIFMLQKRAMRIICLVRLSYRINSSTLFHKCHVLPLPSLATYHAAILAHSIFRRTCPSYLLSHFPVIPPSRTRPQFKIPSSRLYTKVEQRIVLTFNSLPLPIRSLRSITSFKSRVKQHFLNGL